MFVTSGIMFLTASEFHRDDVINILNFVLHTRTILANLGSEAAIEDSSLVAC